MQRSKEPSYSIISLASAIVRSKSSTTFVPPLELARGGA
jgi:hypothetical protein